MKYALAVATTLPGYTKMRELIGERPDVAFSCGIHPLNLDEPYDFTQLRELAADKRVVALGETGLDYYYQKENAALQREVFREHIRIGRELNKPVIVHTRDAREDTRRLSAKNRPVSAAACYTALPKTKRRHQRCWMKVLYLLFRHRDVPQCGADPRSRPHCAAGSHSGGNRFAVSGPVPFRGKENQPAYVRDVAEYMAVLKG